MNTLTKEWLQNTITGIESIIDDKSFVCSEIAFEIGVVNNILTAFKIALASLAAVSDERAAYELFMEKRFGESVDRRRAKNGDSEYMAWDMALGWIIWCHRATMLQSQDSGIKNDWISCSERMPEKNQNVLISVNFDSSLVEPLICSARYTGSTFRRGDATIKPGNDIEQATHWMPLPEPPQEVN